uniref:Lipase_3 domain-containing protein n=1 Tax=Strongyloides venezuelensis TaxID=75913 RepID=A0A0K0FN06_STRVS
MHLLKIFYYVFLNFNLLFCRRPYFSKREKFNSEKAKWLYLLSYFSSHYISAKCITRLIPTFKNYYLLRHHTIPCDDTRSKCTYTVFVSSKNESIIVILSSDHSFARIMSAITSKSQNFYTFEGLGFVNRNFANSFYKIWPFLHTIFSEPKLFRYKVTIVGYSFGGALATLAAIKLRSAHYGIGLDISLYTYGAPRVGNPDFVQKFDEKLPNSFRVVVDKDPVPHFPKCSLVMSKYIKFSPRLTSKICNIKNRLSYYHVGTEVWYPKGTHNLNNYHLCLGKPKNEYRKCSNMYPFYKTSFNQYKFFHNIYYNDVIQTCKNILMPIFYNNCRIVDNHWDKQKNS